MAKSSLLDKIETLKSTADADPNGWSSAVAVRLEAEARETTPGSAGEALESTARVLRAHAPDLARTTASRFAAIVGRLAIGQGDKARLIYLAEGATFRERMRQLDVDSAATREEKKAREEAWGAVKAAAADVIGHLGERALPLLLAAI